MVIDATSGKTVADIPANGGTTASPSLPLAGGGFISDDTSVVIFDLKTNKVLGKVEAADDADGIITTPPAAKYSCPAAMPRR